MTIIPSRVKGARHVAEDARHPRDGPNFVAVTPGDAASFLASAINFNGTADIANASTVAIDAARQIKVWGGDQAGSAHIIIGVTGYYAPLVLSNMGN